MSPKFLWMRHWRQWSETLTSAGGDIFSCCPVLSVIQDLHIVQSLLASFPTITPQIFREVLRDFFEAMVLTMV